MTLRPVLARPVLVRPVLVRPVLVGRPRTTLRAALRTAAAKLLASTLLAGPLVACAPGPAGLRVVRCTDTRHDAVLMQAVIDSSAPTDEIRFDGPCLVDTTVTLLGGRHYRGASAATTLTELAGSDLDAVLASDSWVHDHRTTGDPITLEDLTVEVDRSGNPASGSGVVIRSWSTAVRRLTIRDAGRDGLLVTSLSAHGTPLDNTEVNGTISQVSVTGSGRDGIRVEDPGNSVTDWNLLDSRVADSGSDGIRLDNAAGWSVERSSVIGSGGVGIRADRLYATSINHNEVRDFGADGIDVTMQGGAASTVDANSVSGPRSIAGTGIAVLGVNYGAGQLAVRANEITGRSTRAGVGLSYEAGRHRLTVLSTANLVLATGRARVSGVGVTVVDGS